MDVTLVSVTKPLVANLTTPEELIVYCARVSNPTNQLNKETSPGLVRYLIKHAHWSPFEMCSMCVEIKTSRAIAAQLLRHRSFNFQEFSQRYSQVHEFEPVEWRMQGKTNRQVGEQATEIPQHLKDDFNKLQFESKRLYRMLIDEGVARECARMILPLNTQTTIYMSGTIRSWVHYLNLRTSIETQKEHREIAEKIKQLFILEFPVISEALGYNANVSTI